MKVNFDQGLKEEPKGKPGVYYVEVSDATEEVSKNRDPYFKLKLFGIDVGKTVSEDIVMMGGKGKRVGYLKLLMLGVPKLEGDAELDPVSLIGKRAYVNLATETWNDRFGVEQSKLRPVAAPGAGLGYWSEADAPEDVVASRVMPGPEAIADAAGAAGADLDAPW